MLGHDASFGYMKAVEVRAARCMLRAFARALAPPLPLPVRARVSRLSSAQLSASANLLEKRVSYVCAGLCFAPEHEFRMMLVNRLQRDLASSNVLEVAIGLSAGAKVLTADMIPAVLPLVTNLLKHDQEIIRKKAVMLLHRFLQLQPDSVQHMGDKFRRTLCDKDPAVMGASLHVFHDLIKVDATGYKDLVSSFVSILKQITEHRLPRDFDYHRIPAPWVQMKLLRILSLLGRADQAASESMYEVLLDVMRRADTGALRPPPPAPRPDRPSRARFASSAFLPPCPPRTRPSSAPAPPQASTSATPSSTSACAR
jgi:AP-4 complex subunit epsilon-1